MSWLQDSIDCVSDLIFDNAGDPSSSADLQPCVEQVLSAVHELPHLGLLHDLNTQ